LEFSLKYDIIKSNLFNIKKKEEKMFLNFISENNLKNDLTSAHFRLIVTKISDKFKHLKKIEFHCKYADKKDTFVENVPYMVSTEDNKVFIDFEISSQNILNNLAINFLDQTKNFFVFKIETTQGEENHSFDIDISAGDELYAQIKKNENKNFYINFSSFFKEKKPKQFFYFLNEKKELIILTCQRKNNKFLFNEAK
jgi:hypothetical protein